MEFRGFLEEHCGKEPNAAEGVDSPTKLAVFSLQADTSRKDESI
jgi:hypothetical protein